MMRRRQNVCLRAAAGLILAALACLVLPWYAVRAAQETSGGAAPGFDFDSVKALAAALAAKPYHEETPELPEVFRNLSYDQYRDIRFRPEKSLWRDEGLPFQVQYFHRGFYFRKRVRLNVVADGKVSPTSYSPSLFDFGKLPVPSDLSADLGFAGFRLLYPINRKDYFDEVVVFLGASYFRAVGRNEHYGLSARGLAVDTGLQKEEEFPVFREFWIVKPARHANSITVFALMDSHSLAGAYRFVITPGNATAMDVSSFVYTRRAVERFGVAPLTSMYYHGELGERRVDDFRPEVHDSDGLLMAAGNGERIWRPLGNPARLRISAYQDQRPRGFGLLQRDRDFDHYQDLEALFESRPSTWVEPHGDWGRGSVQLIEIPSDAERNDNIVAFWVPADPVKGGQTLQFDYTLYFADDVEGGVRGGRTIGTRTGAGGPENLDRTRRRFVIEFDGKELRELATGTPVEAVVNTSAGRVISKVVQKNPFTGGWRLSFELVPPANGPADLRCFLQSGTNVLTETWSFQWTGTR